MSTRLRHDEIAAVLMVLRGSLTSLQAGRLDTIAEQVGEDGRFRLADVLDAADFPGQDAFGDFRKRINAVAVSAGVELELVLESRKVAPERRFGWFTGGSLVDAGIASLTGAAAERTGIAHPVPPEVAEILTVPQVQIYLSYAARDSRAAARVTELVETTLAVDRQRVWRIAHPGSVGAGQDVEPARDRLAAAADVRVVLLTASYLRDTERRRGLDAPGRSVVFALGGIPDGSLDLGPLDRHDIRRLDIPWFELTGEKHKRSFVTDIVNSVRRELVRAPARSADELTALSARLAERRGGDDSPYWVPQDAAETSLRESRLGGTDPTAGPPQPAVDRLVAWASAIDGPPLCALLGDVGMGKTTTAKLFTRRLLQLREQGQRAPLPVLFDLRDVRIGGLQDAITLDGILDGMLDATRPPSVSAERLNATTVRSRLAEGNAVVVFDGLDEVLVHLSPHDQRVFTRQLWRVVEGNQSGPGTRMLVTCRTQYFRTIRDEVSCFTGEERQGLRSEHYLALLMQPFRDEQVREYLTANVGRDGDWVDSFLSTIADVHDLTELSGRPLTLRLIADQVEYIETAKLEGRTVRSVDLYGEVVDRWLARDGGKHTLDPEHKQLLMEEIAAGLWRSGRNAWEPAEVDAWLLELLDRRPDLSRHYRERVPDLWKADFRTATFLSRDRGRDTFAFAHRSLFEYFLARYLYRILVTLGKADESQIESNLDALAMAVPSPETLSFLGQSLAGAPDREQTAALIGLGQVHQIYRRHASELALAYALAAKKDGHPHHTLKGVCLSAADLDGWEIGTSDCSIALAGADLSGAALRRAILQGVDLTGADLTGADLTAAELHDCTISNACIEGANLVGTVLRDCAVDNVHLHTAQIYRTQILRCTPTPPPDDGLLLAPLLNADESAYTDHSELHVFISHTGLVWSIAWSPDCTRLLTAGDDGARIWDATTATVLCHLIGHTGPVRSAAWSPDNTRLLTGGDDGARIWDATTATVLRHLTEHNENTSLVRAVAWSPDNTRLLTCGDDGVRIWDATTATVLFHLTEHTGRILSVAWSPDSTRFVTGGDGAHIWDATTATVLFHLTEHNEETSPVRSVAWSPDNTRLLTADSTVRIWDATTGVVQHHPTENTRPILSVAWSPDSSRFVTGGHDARVWDATTATVLFHLTEDASLVWSVAWAPDNARLLTSSGDGTVCIWDATTGAIEHHSTGHNDLVWSIAWAPDNTRLLTDSQDGSACIWNATTGTVQHHLTEHIGPVLAAAWSPDGTRLLTGGRGVCIRDATTGAIKRHSTGNDDPVWSVAWSPDGTRFLTGGSDGAYIWNATTATVQHHLAERNETTKFVRSVAWSPDNTHILTANENGSACIWDAATATVLFHLTENANLVWSVAWAPDGTRFLTGNGDGARIWDTTSGTVLHHLTEHINLVWSVAWAPDSTRFLTGGDDGAYIWDATTATVLFHLTENGGNTSPMRSVTWSPDSTRVLTASEDGSVRVWDATTGTPVGMRVAILPGRESAIFDASTGQLQGASAGAWRWLGWNALHNGRITRLPAESFGPLKPLPTNL